MLKHVLKQAGSSAGHRYIDCNTLCLLTVGDFGVTLFLNRNLWCYTLLTGIFGVTIY